MFCAEKLCPETLSWHAPSRRLEKWETRMFIQHALLTCHAVAGGPVCFWSPPPGLGGSLGAVSGGVLVPPSRNRSLVVITCRWTGVKVTTLSEKVLSTV